MATHKSAVKRNRQSIRKNARNRMVKGQIRNAIRQVKEAVASGNKESAQKNLLAAERVMSKAATKKIIHRNKASTKTSELAKAVNTMAARA